MELKGFALFWLVLFAVTPLMYLFQWAIGRDSGVSLTVILENWMEILPYFILFCIHNFLLAPLFFKNRLLLYFTLSTGVFILFSFYILATIIGPPPGRDGSVETPPGNIRPFSPETMKIVIGALLLLVNLGIKAMVRSVENEKRMQELRAESLSQKMEVLRYQINPHFFMNTLNNIQALVLTEPDKATECISAFSKLMRMVLSEGSAALIPLERELSFVDHFVSLMRLQLPESLEITYEKPKAVTDAEVPALVMVSLVENAFKHGSKSRPDAFIRIRVSLENGRVEFRCANRREAMAIPVSPGEGGIGNDNVRKRLELLYGTDFTLKSREDGDLYEIRMSIPERPENKTL